MARKQNSKSKGQVGKQEPASNTFSTRFDDRQLELIQEAAQVLKVSPAKLVREAALIRAADVLNATGSAKARLAELGRIIVEQILNPSSQYTEFVKLDSQVEPGEEREQQVTFRESREAWDEQLQQPDLEYKEIRNGSVRPLRPKDGELVEIKRALETCGTELVRLILEQWDSVGTERIEYSPRVSAESVLQGGNEEQ